MFFCGAESSVPRDQAVQMAERYSEQMAMVEKKSANGTGASNGKVRAHTSSRLV